MTKLIPVLAAGVVTALVTLWAPSPARSIIINGFSARMVGGGWVAIGDAEDTSARGRAMVELGLPCRGADVGFNPQPDPPGRSRAHLRVSWGGNTFRLDQLATSRCSLGGPDTLEGTGTGACNGQPAVVTFRLSDGGGPSAIGDPNVRADSLRLDIRGGSPACALVLDGQLAGGNVHMVGDPADR